MPANSAPRVRVMLTMAQQRARVRSLAYGASVGAVLACVLVVVAVKSSGWAAWLALIAAIVPITVAAFATRAAVVLARLRAPTAPVLGSSRASRKRSGGRLPVNLGRVARAEANQQAADPMAPPPTDPA